MLFLAIAAITVTAATVATAMPATAPPLKPFRLAFCCFDLLLAKSRLPLAVVVCATMGSMETPGRSEESDETEFSDDGNLTGVAMSGRNVWENTGLL